MLYCKNCKNVFEDSDIRYIWDKSEFWGANYIDNVATCSYCRSENIKNIDDHPRCSCCNEVCANNYIKTADDRCYCEECYLTYSIDD